MVKLKYNLLRQAMMCLYHILLRKKYVFLRFFAQFMKLINV